MSATFYVGDVLDVLGKLPENSVDLVLSSPPFLALRSYLPADHPLKEKEGGSQSTPGEYIDWLLDVVEACDRVLAPHGSLCFELGDTYAGSGGAGGDYDPGGFKDGQPGFRGSGRTPGGRTIDTNEKYERTRRDGERQGIPNLNNKKQGSGQGWPLPKSLSLIPESFRFAMVYGQNPFTGRQTERWRLRNVIRWVRPNPPVGALGDKFRPATSELMVFCKSAKRYFDLDAVRETPLHGWTSRLVNGETGRPSSKSDGSRTPGSGDRGGGNFDTNPAGAPPLDWWNIPLLEGEEPTKMAPKGGYDPVERRQRAVQQTTNHGGSKEARQDFGEAFYNAGNPLGAPPLDWWNIPPGGYEGAHYAVWPPELLIKPIKAMCPEKVCRTCGEPPRRVTEAERYYRGTGELITGAGRAVSYGSIHSPAGVRRGALGHDSSVARRVLAESWADCGHNDYRAGVVLDCFAGSGTTGAVASGHGRDSILIDLDERNYDLALERVGPLVLQRGEIAA